jgi:hypothetical protein
LFLGFLLITKNLPSDVGLSLLNHQFIQSS